jgi:hypothetical protein
MLTLVNTNNYFGHHEFHLTNHTMENVDQIIKNTRWFKPLRIRQNTDTIIIFCFTNYDKASIERLFEHA